MAPQTREPGGAIEKIERDALCVKAGEAKARFLRHHRSRVFTSLGSIQILRAPHFSTLAAKRFCSFKDTILTPLVFVRGRGDEKGFPAKGGNFLFFRGPVKKYE